MGDRGPYDSTRDSLSWLKQFDSWFLLATLAGAVVHVDVQLHFSHILLAKEVAIIVLDRMQENCMLAERTEVFNDITLYVWHQMICRYHHANPK